MGLVVDVKSPNSAHYSDIMPKFSRTSRLARRPIGLSTSGGFSVVFYGFLALEMQYFSVISLYPYFKYTLLGSGSGGMCGRNGRACRVQNVPSQNTLRRELRTGVRKPVTFTVLPIVI